MRISALLPLLSLIAFTSSLAQSDLAQSDAAEVAAREALFSSCGGVEVGALPVGVRPGLYRGKLGTQAITLELTASSAKQIEDDPDHFFKDRYSYDRLGFDIALKRGRAANRTANYSLLAVEAVHDGSDVTARGCFDLSEDGTGLKGAWRTPDGQKSFPVRLARVNVAALKLALPSSPGLLNLKKTDPFTFVRLNHPWKKVSGGIEEPLSGVVYPRLPGGAAALNTALRDKQLELAQEAFGCRGSLDGMNRKSDTDFEGTGTLAFNRARLVSLSEMVSYYCGGAHPDFYESGYTLDAKTGREVLVAGKPGSIWPALNNKQLYALYNDLYIKNAESDCLELLTTSVDETYSRFTQYLMPKGLVIWPNYVPHVGQACADELTIPYASIRKFADPKGPYFLTIYQR